MSPSKKSRPLSARDERLARARAAQAATDRRRRLVVWTSAALALLLVAGSVTWAILRDRSQTPSLSAVRSFDYDGGQHTTSAVDYAQSPPVGGEHDPVWLNCGVYDSPVRDENAVHALEHGAVWITYRPDLPKGDVDTLVDATPDTYAVLSPYEGLSAPVVVSSWGKQLTLDSADDPRLAEFIKAYREGPQTPEPGAPCTGGVDRRA